MNTFRGATALITGASKGLGEAFAEALAARGANLVLVARSEAALAALAERLERAHGVRVATISADLAQVAEVTGLDAALTRKGVAQVDLLINNAGYGLSGDFLSNPREQELGQVALNISALLNLSHVFGNKMAQRRAGGIINVASNASFQAVPYQATYAATKAFVLHFSEALAYELAGQGVRVMASCPGPTATSFFEQMKTSMVSSAMDSSASVAEKTLDAYLRGERVAYPGRASVRLGTIAAQLLPRATVLKIAAAASKKMGLQP